MTGLWKKTNNDEYESSAKVVDGNLILSLPDAINPVVWRMELGSVKASALEVKTQADGTFTLSLKTPKGEVHDIAPFQSRELAVRALMRVSAALQGAQGKISPVVTPVAPTSVTSANDKQGGSAMKWLLALGGVLVVIFLFAYLSSLAPTSVEGTGMSNDATSTGIGGNAGGESGVPQSADELLRGN